MKTPRLQGFWTIIAVWLLALGVGFSQLGRVRDHAASGISDVFHPKGGWMPSDDYAIQNLPLWLEIGMSSVAASRDPLSKVLPNQSIATLGARLSRSTFDGAYPCRRSRLAGNHAGSGVLGVRSRRQAVLRPLYVKYPTVWSFDVLEGRNHA